VTYEPVSELSVYCTNRNFLYRGWCQRRVPPALNSNKAKRISRSVTGITRGFQGMRCITKFPVTPAERFLVTFRVGLAVRDQDPTWIMAGTSLLTWFCKADFVPYLPECQSSSELGLFAGHIPWR
jgi:hypothetical protein